MQGLLTANFQTRVIRRHWPIGHLSCSLGNADHHCEDARRVPLKDWTAVLILAMQYAQRCSPAKMRGTYRSMLIHCRLATG
jgi:hypothetical protein